MTREELKAKALEVISQEVSVAPKEIPLEKSFEDLGFDSMDAVHVMFALEDELDVSLSNEEAASVTNLQSLLDLFARKLDCA